MTPLEAARRAAGEPCWRDNQVAECSRRLMCDHRLYLGVCSCPYRVELDQARQEYGQLRAQNAERLWNQVFTLCGAMASNDEDTMTAALRAVYRQAADYEAAVEAAEKRVQTAERGDYQTVTGQH